MKRMIAVLAAASLALAGCGGSSDDDTGGGGDATQSDGGGSDFCDTVLGVENDLDELDGSGPDEFDDLIDVFRRLESSAPDDIVDDLKRVREAFEAIEEWANDPTGEYPFSDEEDADFGQRIDRITMAIERECDIDLDDADDDADAMADDEGVDVGIEPDDEMTDEMIDEITDAAEDMDDGTIAADDPAIEDEEITITFDDEDDGGGQMTIGGDLPDDFPFPLPATHEVTDSTELTDTAGTMFIASLTAPLDDFDDVVDLYRGFLENEGFDVTVNDLAASETERIVSMYGDRPDTFVDLTITTGEPDGGGDLQTIISLWWSPQS